MEVSATVDKIYSSPHAAEGGGVPPYGRGFQGSRTVTASGIYTKNIPTSGFSGRRDFLPLQVRDTLGGESMPTPCKPVSVLQSEGKSHRTKAELARRQAAEDALSTGRSLRERPEVKQDPAAHKEFLHINGLLKIIGKNDALVEGSVNRYQIL